MDGERLAPITDYLDSIRAGDGSGGALLFDAAYGELRQLARAVHGRHGGLATLQPTALVHEAWLKLNPRLDHVENRSHFFAVAARAMRQVLADHAKAARRQKRGGKNHRLTLDDTMQAGVDEDVDLIDFDDSLRQLAELNARHADIVALRVFGGLTVAEVADELNVSRRTVDSDWAMARAWLENELHGTARD